MAATRAGAGGNLPRTGLRVALVTTFTRAVAFAAWRRTRVTTLATARRTVRLAVFSLGLRTGTIGYLS